MRKEFGLLSEETASPTGRWTLSPPSGGWRGRHQPRGGVASFAELPRWFSETLKSRPQTGAVRRGRRTGRSPGEEVLWKHGTEVDEVYTSEGMGNVTRGSGVRSAGKTALRVTDLSGA
jgi:hypothetical protein